MNQLLIAAKEICAFLSDQRWEYCVIGGLAVQRWGEPRTTLDVDITLLAGFGRESEYVYALLEHFPSRIDDARNFALEHRVLLLRSSNMKDIDIALGALPFEERMIQRAVDVEFAPGIVLPCCTAEDLFVMKVFAGRARDEQDARSIAARTRTLDHAYIFGQLQELGDVTETRDEMLRTAGAILEVNR